MNEQEFLTELDVGLRCSDPMLAALALERCRQYVSDQERATDPHTKELEAMLPRGYQRIPPH